MRTIYSWLLLTEILVVGVVTALFRFIQDRQVAATIAGSLFIALGVVIVVWGIRERRARKTPTFVMGLLHLFFSSIPMLTMRLVYLGTDFSQVRVWGIPGPKFHHMSELIYLLLLIATAFDWYRTAKNQSNAL